MSNMKAPRLLNALSEASSSGETVVPLGEKEFAALLGPHDVNPQHLALAVSGGPDSMALAWCVKQWADDRCRKAEKRPSVMCFIVDHQLRPESADETAAVRQRLAAMGLDAEILRWEHPSITSRVHVQARQARYDLLIAACQRYGLCDLLLAHQRDDQAETILMRFAKGSGIDGLAGMAPVTIRDGVRLVRPLLTVPKDRLIATCRAANIAYVTDPSNAKDKYARGRLRRVQQALAEEGFTPERLVDLGMRAREAKDALDHYTCALLRVAVQIDSASVIRFNLEHLRSAPQAISLRALGACLLAVHVTDYAPERLALLPVLQALRDDAPMESRTLHGCVIGKTDKQATIVREYAAITDEKPIEPGQTVLWDNRWHVTLAKDCQTTGLSVRALGFQSHETVDRLAPELRKRVTQGRARAVLPGIWRGDNLTLIPSLCEERKSEAHCNPMINL